MIDNYAKLYEDEKNFVLIYSSTSTASLNDCTKKLNSKNELPSLSLTVDKISEDSFEYIDILESSVVDLIKEKSLARSGVRYKASVTDAHLPMRIRQEASKVAMASRRSWPNRIIMNSKYIPLMESLDHLYKFQDQSWNIIYDDDVDDVMVMVEPDPKLFNHASEAVLHYKRLDNGMVRLFTKSKNSMKDFDAFSFYGYLSE